MNRLFGRITILILLFALSGVALWTGRASDVTLRQYEKFELQFDVPGDYENPYDPRQVDVTAYFTAPNGEEITINGFYMETGWHVRFTPQQIGDWSYEIEARLAEGSTTPIQQGSFRVIESDKNPGFITVAGQYFQFQSGDSYFPVGQNLGWAANENGGLETYLEWLNDLADSGANYARLYADTAWFIGLDWAGEAGNYTADQPDAEALDTILETAEERGIYLQIVLLWHRSFTDYQGLPVTPPSDIPRPDLSTDFDSHPYKQSNGGPMGSFFNNNEVDRLLRQKLRYMIARWGYSTSIFAWEVVTDADRLIGYDSQNDADFITSLATYVDDIDPYSHLVTIGSSVPRNEFIYHDAVDFVQIRSYQARPVEDAQDQVMLIQRQIAEMLGRTNKPVLITEFSLNPWFEPLQDDPTGVHLRTTNWSSALSGAAGGGMTWWWDTYVELQDLYSIYTPLARFAEGLPWQDLQVIIPTLIAEDTDTIYEPIRIDDFNRSSTYLSPPDRIYCITMDGSLPLSNELSSRIYGTRFNIAGNRPQSFLLTPPIDTQVAIAIRGVSASTTLQIIIDDRVYTTLEVSSSTTINVPITAGEHRLVLDNLGAGWIEFDYLEIRDYRSPLRVRALADRTSGVAAAWIHHREYTWENVTAGIEIPPERYQLLLPNMPAGIYRVEFWDTFSGNVLGQEMISTADGNLRIALLPIDSQLAVRAFRVESLEPVVTPVTPAPTRTPLISSTPTASSTPTFTPSATVTPSDTASPTATLTDTATPSATSSSTPSATSTPAETHTSIPSLSPSPTREAPAMPSHTPSTLPVLTGTPESIIPRQTRTPRP